ncbi:hypothetical protein BB936_10315 [Yersinia enterocolitica]|uniref:hypothetical protein n=1 Tax=Yersinia enterocolitica TaxID=630 RepID=UPI00083DFA76|nr:hypothetical protein [Yersinia enterocolitica]AOF14805.1 hypothetical protein BB936_10315 [Yersinia enterocolitica]
MKSPCLQIANAILQTHMADMGELTRRAIEKNGVFSLKANLHAREKKTIFSLNDYAFRLSVGLEGLLSAAHASGDQDSAQELEQLVTQCNGGDIPKPLHH